MSDSTPHSPASLPANPSIEQLKKQAKELLADAISGREAAAALFRQYLPSLDISEAALHDAQTVLARSYGFGGWTALKEEVDRATVTRLCDAVRNRNSEQLRAILRRRPDLVNTEAPGFGEHRAIHFAVFNRDAQTVRLLVEAGARPDIGIYPHREATMALTIARERGYGDIVAAIEEGERARRSIQQLPDTGAGDAQERLHRSIQQGDEPSAREQIERAPELAGGCDREGSYPLHIAAGRLMPDLVKWLVERHRGAVVPNLAGRTPLEFAALAVEGPTLGRFQAAAEVLRAHGDPLTPRAAVALGDASQISRLFDENPEAFRSQVDMRRGGLLTLAVRLNRLDTLRLLLSLGLDPDERVRVPEIEEEVYSSGSPLWYAAGDGQYEMVESLLAAGADVKASVYASGDALSRAYNARDERMKQLLRAHGATADPATIGLNGDLDAARALVSELDGRPAVVSSSTGEERTELEELLWGAACGGYPELVKLCLSRYRLAPTDRRWYGLLDQPLRIWGHHPHRKFHDVDRAGYPECLRLMLEAGASANVEGSFGRTLLHDVAAFGMVWGQPVMLETERIAFARLLLDAGARLDVRDDLLRSTPLGWAVRWERVELVRLLLSYGAPVEEPEAEPWASPLAWAKKRGNREIEGILREAMNRA